MDAVQIGLTHTVLLWNASVCWGVNPNGNPLQYSCLENSMERRLAGYSPRSHKELDTTNHTHARTHAYKYSQSQVTALYKSGKFSSLFAITASVTFILTHSLGKSDIFLFFPSESWDIPLGSLFYCFLTVVSLCNSKPCSPVLSFQAILFFFSWVSFCNAYAAPALPQCNIFISHWQGGVSLLLNLVIKSEIGDACFLLIVSS